MDTRRLQKSFTDISNYIYVNDGVLKDRVFIDIIRLIGVKMVLDRDGSSDLLKPEHLAKVPAEQIDTWAQKLLKMSIDLDVETTQNARWNIKDSSLFWAAKELSKFNFNDFPADIKGEAFQALVISNLRGDRGEYFTPEPLVSTICKITELKADSRVIDPACGSGGFLYGAFRNGVNPEGLFGAELSNDVGSAAQTRVQILGGQRDQVLIGDAFKVLESDYGTFDRVLMNPPFGSRSKIEDLDVLSKFKLASLKSTSKSKYHPLPPELLFLELAINLLKPNGIIGTVLPDGVLQNSSSRYVRDWLLSHANVEAVISCPTVTFVPYGTGVKTSLLVLKKKATKSSSRKSYLAISESVGYDPRGKAKYKNPDLTSELMVTSDEKLIDEDLTEISEEIARVQKSKTDPALTKGILVDISIDDPRWDAEFFQTQDAEMLEEMQANDYPTLDSVCDLITTKVALRKLVGMQRYIAIADLDSRMSQVVNIQNLDSAELPSRASYLVQANDVITAIAGASTGTEKHASAIIKKDLAGAIVSSGFALLRPTKISPAQLLGLLRSSHFLRQALRLRTGHAIPSIGHRELMSIQIPPVGDPIWKVWEKNISELDRKADALFKFADSVRD